MKDFFNAFPQPQHAIDLFEGEWSSQFPAQFGVDSKGHAKLFEDPNLKWAWEQVGEAGANVLELGPLEGAHSYMLEQLGAGRITAVEARSSAYLKCLVTKEVVGLTKSQFLLGDFLEYLETESRQHDIAFASGVLYHMPDPVRLLELLSQRADRLYLWTVIQDDYEKTEVSKVITVVPKARNWRGLEFNQFEHYYGQAKDWEGFCGGELEYGCRLELDTILRIVEILGFSRVNTKVDENPHGKALCLACSR